MNWREGSRRAMVALSVASVIGWSIFCLWDPQGQFYYCHPIEVLVIAAVFILGTLAGLWALRWMITYTIDGFRQEEPEEGAPKVKAAAQAPVGPEPSSDTFRDEVLERELEELEQELDEGLEDRWEELGQELEQELE